MKQGQIFIHGVIGSYTDEKGQEVKGVELLDVISQVQSQPEVTSFLAHIKGPGGLVDVGDAIYDYLESLKAKGTGVDTITDGDIGSIATKVFLAGTNRTIIDGHEFFIHNPWNQPEPGDANSQELQLGILRQKESQLRSFYQQHTKITDVGLKGLMDKQTGMNADQAVALGFATQKITSKKLKALALTNSNMSKENTAQETLAQKIINGVKEALGVKAEVKAEGAPTELTGKPVMVDGAAPADGVYTIVGGLVTAVEPVAATPAEGEPTPGDPAPAAGQANPNPNAALEQKLAALEQANAAQAKELEALKAIDVKAAIDTALAEFKNTLPVGGKPMKAFNNNGQGQVTHTHKSINDVMAEKRDQRKKQLNGN